MAIIVSGESRIIRQDILNENEEKIGQIAYNPNDINALDKFWAIYDKLNRGSQKQKEIEIELGAMDVDILDRDLETVEEFQTAGDVIAKKGESIKAAITTFDDIAKGLDEIFGEGTCQLFTKGYVDEVLLNPLIEGVMPDFEKAAKERKALVDKYKRNREQRRAAEKAEKKQSKQQNDKEKADT
jgi:hypothetical protein